MFRFARKFLDAVRRSRGSSRVGWTFSPGASFPTVLDALEKATTNTLEIHFDAKLVWQGDVTRPLQEFGCWCAEQTIICDRDSKRKEPPEQLVLAVETQKEWLGGRQSYDEMAKSCQVAALAVQHWSPSNFCTGMCANFAMKCGTLWPLAAGNTCAQAWISAIQSACHAAALASCQAAGCDFAELSGVEATPGSIPGMTISSIGCPESDGAGEHAFKEKLELVKNGQRDRLTNLMLIAAIPANFPAGNHPSVDGSDLEWRQFADQLSAFDSLLAEIVCELHCVID